MSQIKRVARDQAMATRQAAFRAEGATAGAILAARGLPVGLGCGARVVSGFHAFGDEITVLPLLAKLAQAGWITCLPVVVKKGQPLEFRAWAPGEALVPGRWNIPQPPEGATVVEPDVLLVPLLAFDRQGYRLGYGGGFYDRTLAGLRAHKSITAIGVAFAAQEVQAVPRESFDEKLDYIMTERECFRCG
ncbi:MAG TPA: 5-formyltetrahydrofolate cyclo-ligase [Aestuariivirga sp.]|nr:5-formyltetrahydrofolate cyclo-ligase [Aestuariivirga sp.]